MFASASAAIVTILALSSRSNAQQSFPVITTVASLHSINPTAVPLSSLVPTHTSQATVALVSQLTVSATPGATPPISGAPPLPSFVFSPTLGYPKLDHVPLLNNSLVQQWIAEVKNTGISIPNIPLSVDGSCGSDEAKVNTPSYCWWTCGGCTRETDITTCPDKLTWGLSYDDGPSFNTPDLLNFLEANDLHSTFFVVGSRAISHPDVLQAEYMAGHQLSVHTWSHPYLTTLSNEQVIAELGWTKYAMRAITGVTPITFRPPYGDIDDRIRAIAKAMQLTPIMWSNYSDTYFDTNDWYIQSGYPVDGVIDTFEEILNNATELDTGFIVLEHDLFPNTVDLAVGYILPDALARGTFNLKSIIECLYQPLANAYLETNNNKTNPIGGATTFPATASSTGTSKPGSTPSGAGSGGGSSAKPTNSGAAPLALTSSGAVISAVMAVIGSAVGAFVVL